MRQTTLLCSGFLGEDVALVGMLSFDFSGCSKLKTLLCTRIGFHFGHLRGIYWLIISFSWVK
jgi:hypothetical protein